VSASLPIELEGIAPSLLAAEATGVGGIQAAYSSERRLLGSRFRHLEAPLHKRMVLGRLDLQRLQENPTLVAFEKEQPSLGLMTEKERTTNPVCPLLLLVSSHFCTLSLLWQMTSCMLVTSATCSIPERSARHHILILDGWKYSVWK